MATKPDLKLTRERSSAQTTGFAGSGGAVALISVLVLLVVGIQLGGLPWRYRKQLWQLQGGLVGVAAGFVLGRFSRPSPPQS